MNYVATIRSGQRKNEQVNVRAGNIEDAARIAACRFYGHRASISAQRVTGTRGLSGMFQAYLPVRESLTSHGDNFHVWNG